MCGGSESTSAKDDVMHDDEELVSRVRNGELEAFEMLYDRYKRPLYRAAVAITHNEDAAEEILQDAFIRAYRAMDRVDASKSLSPWLHRIVVNLSYNWTRGSNRWPLSFDTVIDSLLAGPAACPERVAERGEMREIVQEAIAALSFKRRAVLVLYYVQGFSLQEIAYILDCPLGTVKSRLHHACKALREHLREDARLAEEVVYATS
jgi:RNA polymerase sigma-70 factor (ECF subfamily)